MSDDPVERAVKAVNERFPGWSPQPSAVGYARAVAAEALQQAGESKKNDALRAIMPFAEIGAASEIARFNAMHLPDDHSITAYIGIDRVRAAMSAARDALSPLPQQTALVEGQSPELDDINGRLA